MTFSINRHQSISKDFEISHLNEDRIKVTDKFIAVADGAGGTGILCGEWAEFLLDKIPAKPITSFKDFKTWLETYLEVFLEKYEPIVALDSYKMRRFYEEGSSSTLAVVWKIGKKYFWITYGDCHIFVFNDNRIETFPYKNSKDFERGSYLINWTIELDKKGFKYGSCTLANGFIVSSDALSKHIFEKFIDSNNLNDPLTIFYECTASIDSFIKYIKSEPTIVEDDYSIIVIKSQIK